MIFPEDLEVSSCARHSECPSSGMSVAAPICPCPRLLIAESGLAMIWFAGGQAIRQSSPSMALYNYAGP